MTIYNYIMARYKDRSKEEQHKVFEALSKTPGTGAAGGLVAGMIACFPKAKVVKGMDYISELIDLESMISEATVVCTGEGSLDT